MNEKKPGNKHEGLTTSDIEDLEQLRTLMTMMYEGNDSGMRLVEFMVEQERLWKILAGALEELKEKNPQFYYRLLIVVRGDSQKFFDLINQIQNTDKDLMGGEHLDANLMIGDISDLRFTGLFTNDGFRMREQLIDNLSDQADANKIVNVLKQLQKLLPELEPGEDFGF